MYSFTIALQYIPVTYTCQRAPFSVSDWATSMVQCIMKTAQWLQCFVKCNLQCYASWTMTLGMAMYLLLLCNVCNDVQCCASGTMTWGNVLALAVQCSAIYNIRQYYTLVEQKAILLIFISIVDKNINFRSKWNWRKGQFELIKISIDSSIYSRICLYLDIEKNINWSQSQSN